MRKITICLTIILIFGISLTSCHNYTPRKQEAKSNVVLEVDGLDRSRKAEAVTLPRWVVRSPLAAEMWMVMAPAMRVITSSAMTERVSRFIRCPPSYCEKMSYLPARARVSQTLPTSRAV